MTDDESPTLLRRLKELFSGGNGETAGSEPALPDEPGGESSECEDVEAISCSEAAEKVYEYLDGELDSERAREVRCHVEQCRRCYPMYNWEQMFLDFVRENADRAEANPELREKVEALLDREAEG